MVSMHRYWTFWLILACVLVFVVQILFVPFTNDVALVSADVLSRPWTLVTSIFAHAGFNHLFYNMLALFLFGTILESVIGGKKFLAIYFSAGIIGAIATLPFYTASLGASGAIFGILGALVILRPKMIVYVSYVPMPMVLAAFVWVVIDLFGMLVPTGTADSAHLAGIAIGLIAGVLLKKKYGVAPAPKREPLPKVTEEKMRNWENKWIIGRRA
jgi:membrane associated rhomboid family serine protease